MIAGAVALVVLVVIVARAKARKSRLPTLTHDYSSQRAIYQRYPGRGQRRRFK